MKMNKEQFSLGKVFKLFLEQVVLIAIFALICESKMPTKTFSMPTS